MVELVIGTDSKDIDKAVEALVVMEKGRQIFKFNDIIEDLIGEKDIKELPDVDDAIILLDYSDILARHSSTKRAKLMTWMMVQSRQRNNIWIAKAIQERKGLEYGTIDKRVSRSVDIQIWANREDMELWDRRTGEKKTLPLGEEGRINVMNKIDLGLCPITGEEKPIKECYEGCPASYGCREHTDYGQTFVPPSCKLTALRKKQGELELEAAILLKEVNGFFRRIR